MEINEEKFEKLFEITKKQNSDYTLNLNKIEYDETDNISSLNNAWFLLKPDRMDRKLMKYKINEGDIIKIGRITIRIKEIKLERNNNDYYLNKNGNNISKNSINIINNNNRIINDILEIRNNKSNIRRNTRDMLKTGTNQTMITTNKSKKKLILKEDKIYDINIIHQSSEVKSENEKDSNNDNNNELYIKRTKSINKICRICYMEEDDKENNPLFNPCICSGSMKYIHYNCLKHWITNKCYTKIETLNKNCIIYNIKPLECELCKTLFPDVITKNGKSYKISELKPEYENYLFFESLTLDKNKNKYYYILSLNENDNIILVGRDKESHVLFSDISVSRIHCIFHIENNDIYIHDNDSTFGTLILMQSKSIDLKENSPLYMQIGRTFFKILPEKKKSNFCLCCNVSESPNDKYYFNQNEKNIYYHKTIKNLNLEENNDIQEKINNNEEKEGTNIIIKKIIIKKKDEKNNNFIKIRNNITNNFDNANINTEKSNAIKDISIDKRALRKIIFNDNKIEKKKKENIFEINKKTKNILNSENQNKSIESSNKKDKDLLNNNSQSIYLEEDD